MTPKEQIIKKIRFNEDFLNFVHQKTLSTELKGWEKIFVSHVSKGLTCRTNTEFLKLNQKNNPLQKWAKDLDIPPMKINKWPIGT